MCVWYDAYKTYLQVQKDLALLWTVFLVQHQRWVQISRQVSGNQLHKKKNYEQPQNADFIYDRHLRQTPYPLSGQLFHMLGTLFELAGRTGPLCFSSGSS